MPFQDCACHVFAITGYVSNDQAHDAHESYAFTAGKLPKPSNEEARNKNVKTLVDTVRKATGAVSVDDAECIVYGGFRGRDSLAPEHMWVEWNGSVFDTMPDHPLRATKATPFSRAQPPCENSKFDKVGRYKTVLTTAQLNNIKEEKLAKPVWED